MSHFKVPSKVVCIKPFTCQDPDISTANATPNPRVGEVCDLAGIEVCEPGFVLFLTGFCAGHMQGGQFHGEEVGYDSAHFVPLDETKATAELRAFLAEVGTEPHG